MIGFLRGILLDKEVPNIIIEVHGIGYEIQIPVRDFSRLPSLGSEASLYIHYISRDDGDFLYGFLNKEQRLLFRSLIKVNSVGPKIALAILSAMDPSVFIQHLSNSDVDALEAIPGIGAKMARRLVIELRDKISDLESLGMGAEGGFTTSIHDAVSALVSLGYKAHEARQALACHKDKNLSSEELVRLALKKIK